VVVVVVVVVVVDKRMIKFMVLSSWQATSKVHPVHMMSMDRHQAAADPQPRPNDPGCESACRLPVGYLKAARNHAHHLHYYYYYYYSAQKLILILPFHRG